MTHHGSARAARGVSLLEVMVAIVVFSLGLLGLALMQIKGAQFGKEAGSRTHAILQARSIADAMRANPSAVSLGSYTTYAAAPPTALVSCASNCTSDQVASNDVYVWLQRLKAEAAGSSGTIAGPSSVTGAYTVTVTWSGQGAAGTSTSDSYSFDYLP
ncbi:MAG: type IV pilus modification protein PilV [Xanthomonadaceae bacterium]|nr:type IV pilus modification protein PilV [Xanthomonadaceae bacterium]